MLYTIMYGLCWASVVRHGTCITATVRLVEYPRTMVSIVGNAMLACVGADRLSRQPGSACIDRAVCAQGSSPRYDKVSHRRSVRQSTNDGRDIVVTHSVQLRSARSTSLRSIDLAAILHLPNAASNVVCGKASSSLYKWSFLATLTLQTHI